MLQQNCTSLQKNGVFSPLLTAPSSLEGDQIMVNFRISLVMEHKYLLYLSRFFS